MSRYSLMARISALQAGWQRSHSWLLAILLLALAVRAWAVAFDLPQLTDPDEPLKVFLAQRIFKTGDLNPHYFLKPSLFLYLNALTYIPFYWFGRLRGDYATPADIAYPQAVDGTIGIGYTAEPATFIMGRLLTVLVGTITVYLVYRLGKQVSQRPEVGLWAALLLALSPIDVRDSQLVATDTYMILFLVLTALWAVRLFERGQRADYLWAGVAIGLTAAGKYNGAIIALMVVVAHLLRAGWRQLIDRKLLLSAYVALGTFLLVTPFAILDWQTFIGNVAYEYLHYSSVGHPGREGGALLFYLGELGQNFGPLLLVALIGMGLLWRRDRRLAILLLSFPLVHFLFINLFVVRIDRMLLLLHPFLALFAGLAIVAGVEGLGSMGGRSVWPRLAALLLFVWPATIVVRADVARAAVSSQTLAADWIEANVPAGARIMVESYAPYLDPGRYEITGIMTLSRRTPAWLAEEAYEYAVFSSGIYQRYLEAPDFYAAEAAQYEALFAELELLQEFDEAGTIIRVYQVPPE